MPYWLMKSEPDEFSIEDLDKLGTARWDGVRNYQARNFLRQMGEGDQFFFITQLRDAGYCRNRLHHKCSLPGPRCARPRQRLLRPQGQRIEESLERRRSRLCRALRLHASAASTEGRAGPRTDAACAERQPSLGDAGQRKRVERHPGHALIRPSPRLLDDQIVEQQIVNQRLALLLGKHRLHLFERFLSKGFLGLDRSEAGIGLL